MPRPTRARTSLPGHSRAPTATKQQDDLPAFNPSNDDAMMLDIGQGPDTSTSAQEPTLAAEVDDKRPPPKQKKADKLYARHEALIAKITAGATPYSKSHNRRLKRAAKPENNLVTSLSAVTKELEEMAPEPESESEEEEDSEAEAAGGPRGVPGRVGKGVGEGGKGQEKLTAKKRSRVLNAEAMRMPAVMANPAFAKNPFATIRLHTQNTMEKAKVVPKPASMNKKRK